MNHQAAPAASSDPVLIDIRNLTKVYPMGKAQVRALAGVTLQVARGEFCCIMGASGSGKSTLLNLIGGLDRPTSGEIEVGDVALHQLDENALAAYRRNRVGFVFQSFNLVSTMTAQQNVEFPMVFARVPARQRHQRAHALLEAVGLSQRVTHKPTELSGGEQQRVALARALVNRPSILLADEPTGNLDSGTGSEILDIMLRANREGNVTIVLVTHDPGVARYASRVIRMKDGKILGEESAAGLAAAAALISG